MFATAAIAIARLPLTSPVAHQPLPLPIAVARCCHPSMCCPRYCLLLPLLLPRALLPPSLPIAARCCHYLLQYNMQHVANDEDQLNLKPSDEYQSTRSQQQ